MRDKNKRNINCEIKLKMSELIILCIISFLITFTYWIFQKNVFIDKYLELEPTENLKQIFDIGQNDCSKKNLYTAFEFECCTWEYVKFKSKNDYKILEKIRTYCLYSTKNEYDRRKCIELIIQQYSTKN